jgi:drug/metabolite transporter (DMT)-like permease
VQNTQAFWTTLFGYLINKEMFLKIELIGILACFGGVVLMAQSSSANTDAEAEKDNTVS